MSWVRGVACCALACALSCASSGDQPAPTSQRAQLAPGILVQVGSDQIALDTVVRIAKAQRVSPVVAREHATSDALFAAGARAAFQGGSVVAVLERAAWSRALLEGLKAEAAARGPGTDTEIGEITALRWQDLDRPESARTTHAVARVQGPDTDAKAKAVAERIAEAVRSVHDPDEFIRLAQAVPHEGIDVRAERLPAVTSDGRSYDPDNPSAASQGFDKDFSRAANGLSAGEISAPVKSAFGYHVILCEARLPALHVSLEQRRTLLNDEILKLRAERAKQDLLARLSRENPTMIARSAEDLTSLIRVPE